MPTKFEHKFSPANFRAELAEHDHNLGDLHGWMFEGLLLYVDYQNSSKSNGATSMVHPQGLDESGLRMKQAVNSAMFAGAEFTTDLADEKITHILVNSDKSRVRILREKLSK